MKCLRSQSNILGAVDFSSFPDFPWLDSIERTRFASSRFRFLGRFASDGKRLTEFVSSPLRNGALSLVSDVTLHNRLELSESLGIAPDADEEQVILAAYEKWGDDCGRFLLGEFAFAIWDDRLQRLFCCRDQLGFRPFFYWQSSSRFVFGSDSKSILDVPGIPRKLNTRKFAGLAVLGGGQTLHDEDTFHSGIQSLPNGCSLTVTRNGVRQARYWTPEIKTSLIPKGTNETFEALRELLFRAVECRIPEDSTAVVELSGGLDSSSITAIAARHLEKKGRTLLAIAGVLPDESLKTLPDEREYVAEFRAFENVRIEYVSATGCGPFDMVGNFDSFIASPIRAAVSYLHDAFKEVAIQNGATVQLRGMLGELGPTHRGDRYFVELAARFRWFTLAQELVNLRRSQGVQPLRYFIGRCADLKRPTQGRRALPGVLLTPEFLNHRQVLKPFVDSSPDQRHNQLANILRFLRGHATWRSRVIEDGIRFSYPWLDKRVLEFCLAAPPALKVRNGYHRYLMRGALDGVLPPKIQWRTSKTPFSPDYYMRYNSQLGKALAFLDAIGPKDPIRSVIEIDRLRLLMKTVDPYVVSRIARDVVPRNLYAICFLRQFPEFQ